MPKYTDFINKIDITKVYQFDNRATIMEGSKPQSVTILNGPLVAIGSGYRNNPSGVPYNFLGQSM